MGKHSRFGPVNLGDLKLSNRVFYSPLAGCSDFPFRKICAEYKPGLIYCEMVKMDALIRNEPNTFHLLDYDSSMHPIGAQLCGSRPEIAGLSAKMIEDLGFDVVDLNCGCPVDKVTKDGSGSGLLKNSERIGEILHEMVRAVSIPVTVKIRAGWDDETILVEEATKIAEQAGAKAIAVHGRTRKQAYKGPANWGYIRQAVQAAKDILVIGNGDVFDAGSAIKMFDETGCDVVLASRGTLGGPWLAEDICRALCGELPVERSQDARRASLRRHFYYMRSYLPEHKVITDMRRVGCWYIKKKEGTRGFRAMISRAESVEEIQELIEDFSL